MMSYAWKPAIVVVMREECRVCVAVGCGATFPTLSRNAKRCPACREAEAQRLSDRLNERRKAERAAGRAGKSSARVCTIAGAV